MFLPNYTPTYEGYGPTYGLDGGMCPPFQGNPWTNAEDPTRPPWVVYGKEEGMVGILGILETMLPEVPPMLVLGNRADPGLILLCRTNKRPTVLALSATTCAQVAVSPESGFCKQRGILLYLSL